MKVKLKNGVSFNLPTGFEVELNAEGSGLYVTFVSNKRYIGDGYSFESVKDVLMSMMMSQFRTRDRVIAYLLSQ